MSKLVWPVFLALSLDAYAAEMPLVVDQLVTGASSHVRLTNTGRQPITAWSLAASSTDNGTTRRVVHTADGYLSEITHGLPQSSNLLDRIQPGESRDFPLDPLPAGSTVDIVAVVLDDGTAIGDEEVIAGIFARRAKERDALRSVVDAFNEVLGAEHGAAALESLRRRFTALLQREESIPCRAALDAVQTYARATNDDQIDQSLNTYRAFVAREYDLAAKHATRRR
jgi:hypothetical protein